MTGATIVDDDGVLCTTSHVLALAEVAVGHLRMTDQPRVFRVDHAQLARTARERRAETQRVVAARRAAARAKYALNLQPT